MVPVTVPDSFADEGKYLLGQVAAPPLVVIKPDVAQAHESRERVVRFFRHKL